MKRLPLQSKKESTQQTFRYLHNKRKKLVRKVLKVARVPQHEITGFCCPTLGLEGSLILGAQVFKSFNVKFKDQDGNVTTKSYSLSTQTAGLQFGFSGKLSFIFFLDTDHNFFNMETIDIGKGVNWAAAGLFGFSFTMATLIGLPGAILIVSLDLGFLASTALVMGGTLTPVLS